jgi:hypothetical protein
MSVGGKTPHFAAEMFAIVLDADICSNLTANVGAVRLRVEKICRQQLRCRDRGFAFFGQKGL